MTRPPITPGTWDTTINNDREPCVILRGESETIAVCCELLEDEAEANARAIAALPDLLAALETALSVIEDLPYPANHPADNLRAALTKAGYTF